MKSIDDFLGGVDHGQVAEEIRVEGWCLVDRFLSPGEIEKMREEQTSLREQGEFRPGKVGRKKSRQRRSEIRNDSLSWWDPLALTPIQSVYLQRLDGLRAELNRRLFFGLADFEVHYACFPPGGYYRPHLDRHRNTRSRIISAVLYLDEDWREEDGGQLRIYTDEAAGKKGPFLDVLPQAGRLVLFLSATIWHEVKVAHRHRHTTTGWFRSATTGPPL